MHEDFESVYRDFSPEELDKLATAASALAEQRRSEERQEDGGDRRSRSDGRRPEIMRVLDESKVPLPLKEITRELQQRLGLGLDEGEVHRTLRQMAFTMQFAGSRTTGGSPRRVWRVARLLDGTWAAYDLTWSKNPYHTFEPLALWHYIPEPSGGEDGDDDDLEDDLTIEDLEEE